MPIGWSALTFSPSSEALHSLRTEWSWVLTEDFEPILFSVLGDVFYTTSGGGVFWLNIGTAEVRRVADSVEEFRVALDQNRENWLLPSLVEALHREGKIPQPGECYTYAVLPIFNEGKYEPWNFKPVPAESHFALTACIHNQIRSLPDGTEVRIDVVP